MFERLHIAAQAMIWLAIVDAVGFTVISLVLIKAIREQRDSYHRIHRDQLDVLIKLLARDDRGDRAEGTCGLNSPGHPRTQDAGASEDTQ